MSENNSAPPGLSARMSGREWPMRYVIYAVLVYAVIQTGVLFYKVMIKDEHPSEEVRKAKAAGQAP